MNPPLPVFVVESAEVFKLGDFFEILSQFVQLPVLLSVEMGLHEGSDLKCNQIQISFKRTRGSRRRKTPEATAAAYLKTVLWVHEEVSPDVVKHDGVLPVVKFSVLAPYHAQGLHLDRSKPSKKRTLRDMLFMYECFKIHLSPLMSHLEDSAEYKKVKHAAYTGSSPEKR